MKGKESDATKVQGGNEKQKKKKRRKEKSEGAMARWRAIVMKRNNTGGILVGRWFSGSSMQKPVDDRENEQERS